MTPTQAIFLITSGLILFSALMVVTLRNLVHSALFLVLALFGVAVTFVLLEAGFLAVVQVLVYIGAIAILLIFAVMLTRNVMTDENPPTNQNYKLAAAIAALFMVGLIIIIRAWPDPISQPPELANAANKVAQLGEALVSPNAYAITFEIASVLLVAAMIGAIVVAWRIEK
jgi:NADH-quinone oxidoreductase subunit J